MRFLIVMMFSLFLPLSAGSCLQGCLDCDSDTTCTACHQGFELTLLGGCVAGRIQGCSLYADGTTCVRCRPTYQLISNSCVREYSGCMVKTDQQCAKCSSELTLAHHACLGVLNCQQTSTTRCLLCTDGFSLVGDLCVAQPENCVWANPSNGVCMQCRSTHQSSGYKCVPNSLFSSNCDLQDEKGRCQQCKQGYTNIAGSCFGREEAVLMADHQNPSSQSNRTNPSLFDLAEEPNNHTNSQSSHPALQPQLKSNGSMGNSSSTGGKDSLQSSLELVLSKLAIFCKSFNAGGSCKECFAGFYMAGAYCLPIDPYCKNYSTAAGSCHQCYSGYALGPKKKCVLAKETPKDPNCKIFQGGQCLACYLSYYLKQGGCVPNDPLCKNTSLEGECIACYEGYLLQDGQCVFNPSNAPNTFDPFCIRINGTDCLLCANGYYVDDTGFCSPLSLNCLQHDLNGRCLQCLSGFQLVEDRCLLSVEYCLRYRGTGCTECAKGYRLSEGVCAKADATCATYSEEGVCLACVATYYLVGGKCVFPSMGFDPLCTSYLNSFCSSCRQGSFLANYRCFPIDPDCTAFDYTRLRCLHCANGLAIRGVGCR